MMPYPAPSAQSMHRRAQATAEVAWVPTQHPGARRELRPVLVGVPASSGVYVAVHPAARGTWLCTRQPGGQNAWGL